MGRSVLMLDVPLKTIILLLFCIASRGGHLTISKTKLFLKKVGVPRDAMENATVYKVWRGTAIMQNQLLNPISYHLCWVLSTFPSFPIILKRFHMFGILPGLYITF